MATSTAREAAMAKMTVRNRERLSAMMVPKNAVSAPVPMPEIAAAAMAARNTRQNPPR
jgi:hypothetical protein